MGERGRATLRNGRRQTTLGVDRQTNMTIRRALTTILGSALGCGAGGALIGYLIGRFLPGAYRGLFSPVPPDFSPTDVGVGLGIPQGAFFGAIVGTVAVAIVT